MIHRAFLLHALSSLHAGTGQAIDRHIDLPIARYKATGIPYLPASSFKGVLRDALDPHPGATAEDRDRHRAVFGHAPGEDGPEHKGAVDFGKLSVESRNRLLGFGRQFIVTSVYLGHFGDKRRLIPNQRFDSARVPPTAASAASAASALSTPPMMTIIRRSYR